MTSIYGCSKKCKKITGPSLPEQLIIQLEDVRVSSPNNLVGIFGNGQLSIPVAPLIIDGVQLELQDRVLLWNQTNQEENGIYKVASSGGGTTVLIRTVDFKPNQESSIIQVLEGTDLAETLWINIRNPDLIIDNDPILFYRISEGSASSGNVNGIPPTVIGNLASWSDTLGTTIQDSGLSIVEIENGISERATLTLTDTNWTTIPTSLVKGTLFISVDNTNDNSPTAGFVITKRAEGITAGINRLVSSPGLSGEQLEIRWNANSPLEIRKDILEAGSNGDYLVVFQR